MGRPTNKEIVDVWDGIEEAEPEISTEQLFARVRDHFIHQAIDEVDVAAALAEAGDD